MSEFTSGNIMLVKEKDFIRKNAKPGSLIYPLNEKWFALLTEDNYMEYQEAPDYIYIISKGTPVLYFYNFEDHFWGFRVFHNGEEVADLHISYEFSEEIVHEVARERFPGVKLSRLLFNGEIDKIRNELEQNKVFEEELKNIFNNCNTDVFRFFKISDDLLGELNRIFDINYINCDINKGMRLVDEFKAIIGIEEMSYIRHERILESGEYEELL